MTDDFISRYGSKVGIARSCSIFGVPVRSYNHRTKLRHNKALHDAQHTSPRGDSSTVAPESPSTTPRVNNDTTGTETTPTCRYCKIDNGVKKTRTWRLHPSALTLGEREEILKLLCSPRFVDIAAEQVYWTLLDEGTYYCSTRTMYRILADHHTNSDRRRRRHMPKQAHGVPCLHASAPNQVWTWDVTLLPSLIKGKWFYLYVVIDIFSRKIVGWLIDDCESKENAEKLLRETCKRHGIEKGQLTIHADRGSIMKARNVQELFTRFGVTKSHSRPRVSNDNPFIESFFKTTKYRYDYPLKFTSIRAARRWVSKFIRWYNDEHHHCGIAYFHPSQLHNGTWIDACKQRQTALDRAYEQHPERFHKRPVAQKPPENVWINQPIDDGTTEESDDATMTATEEVVPV